MICQNTGFDDGGRFCKAGKSEKKAQKQDGNFFHVTTDYFLK